MILLIMAFFIAIVITNTVVSNRLKAKTTSDLNNQALAIIETIDEAQFDMNQPRRIVAFMRNTNVSNLIPSDIILLNTNRTVVYKSNPAMSDETVLLIVTKAHEDFVRVMKTLRNDEKIIGYLVLTTEIRHIDTYTTTLRRALILGMFVALIIGFLVAVFMRRNIVKPIVTLTKNIRMNMEEPTMTMTSIETGDEIEELYSAYASMNREVNAHLEERKRFFQNASHELKTPLMSIQGYAEAIRDGVVEGDEIDDSLDIIIGKSKELKRTVESIIYLSKLVNDDFDFQPERVQLESLIHTVIENQTYIAAEKNVRILFEPGTEPFELNLDKRKFESVIENLLSNAIRYADSVVKVEMHATEDTFIIKVMDDGKGLNRGEEKQVFERFYKGENGHSGIGLAIAAEIVAHHGGTIRAGNHISGGAVFEIRLDRN